MKYKDTQEQQLAESDTDLSLIPERDEVLAHSISDEQPPVDTFANDVEKPTVIIQRSGSVFTSALLWLLVLGLGGFCGWQFLEMEKLQTYLASNSSQTSQQIDQLQSKLTESDQEVILSTSSLQDKVTDNSSEIRKLWAIANDRNRKSIEAQKKLMSELDKQLKSNQVELENTQKSLVKIQTELKAAQANIAKVDIQLISQLSKDVQASDKKLTELGEKITNNTQKQEQLQANLKTEDKQFNKALNTHKQTTDIQIETLREQLDQLDGQQAIPPQIGSRITTNEDAISSIDKGRAKTSKDIIALKQQLNSYKRSLDSHKSDITKLKQSLGIQ